MDNDKNSGRGDMTENRSEYVAAPVQIFELGKQAQSAFDYPKAIELFSDALSKGDIQPELAYEILDQRAECHDLMGEFKEELEDLDQMVSIAQQIGDPHKQTDIVFRQLFTAARMGNSAKIREIEEMTKQVAENKEDISISAATSLAIGYSHWISEKKTDAQEYFEQALHKYRAAGDRENEANTLAALGSVVLDAGNQELSGKYSRDAMEIWRSLGNRRREATSINAWSLTTSDYAQKRDAGEEALEIFISIGDRWGQCQMYNNLSLLYGHMGLYSTARKYARRAVDMVREMGARFGLALYLDSLARAEMNLENFSAAETVFKEGQEVAQGIASKDIEGFDLFGLGRVALMSGQADKARDAIQAALENFRVTNLGSDIPSVLAWLGAAYLALDDPQSARLYTAEAVTELDAIGIGGSEYPPQEIWWWHYKALSYEARQGEQAHPEDSQAIDVPEGAWSALQRAREITMEGIASLSDVGLRRNYLNKVDINRRIIKEWAEQASLRGVEIELADSSTGDVQAQLQRQLAIGVRMNERREVQALTDFVMDELIELSGAERAMIVFINETGERHTAASYGFNVQEQSDFLVAASASLDRVELTSTPIIRQDVDARDFNAAAEDPQSGLSMLCVPLITKGRTSGVIYADNHKIFGRFTQADVDLLASFANQVAAALENAQLYQSLEQRVGERTVELSASNNALEQRNAELGIINSVQDGLATKLDFQEIIDLVGTKIQEIFDIHNMAISILDRKAKKVNLLFNLENGKRWPINTFPFEENTGVIVHVLMTNQPILVHENFLQFAQDLGSTETIGDEDAPMAESVIMVPIMGGDEAIGTIGLYDYEKHKFDESDLRLLTTLAGSMSVALENARLFDETNRLLDETQQRSAELAIINSVQEGLATKLDFQEIIDLVGTKIQEIFNISNMAISILDRKSNQVDMIFHLENGKRFPKYSWPFEENSGIMVHVLMTNQPVLIHEDYVQFKKDLGDTVVLGDTDAPMAESLVMVPIMVGDEAIGTIGLYDYEKYKFSESDLRLLTTLASSMSVALENARLFDETNRLLDETQQRNAELTILNSVGDAMAQNQDVETITRIVGDKVRDIFKAEAASIHLYDAENQIITTPYGYDLGYVETEPFEFGRGLTSLVIETRKPLMFGTDEEAQKMGSFHVMSADSDDETITESYIGVPIIVSDRVLGVVSVQSYRKHAYDDSSVRLLSTLATSMGVAIENARLFEETNRLLVESQQQAAEMATVNTVGQAITSELELDALIELIGDQVRDIFDADITYVALYDKQTNLIEFPYSVGEDLETMQFGEGLTSKIIETAEPLLINEEVNKRVDEIGATHSGVDVESYLGVPIMIGKQAIGVISVQSKDHLQHFDQDDVRLLTTIASNVGAAIRNAQLYQETQQRADEMAALTEIGREISATLELENVLERIANRAQELLNARTATIRLVEEDGMMPTVVAIGQYAEKHRGTMIKMGEGITGNVAKTGNAEIINDPRKDKRIFHIPGTPDEEEELEAIIFAPLKIGERVIGVMGLWRDRPVAGPFSENDLNFLKNLARQAANAIENARLFEEVQREKLYSEALLQNSPVAIVTTDLENNVVSWNPAAESLFGHQAEDAIGVSAIKLISNGRVDEDMQKNFNKLVEGGRVSTVTQRYRKDGSSVDVELLALPVVMEGKQVGLISIYHDITELIKARHEAEAANDAKSAFLATMSHEIRTPMNGVIGMTSLLLDTELDAEQRDFTETIRNSGEALLTVINDILDFSKIEAGKMELEEQPFDLRDCLESSLDLLKLNASEKGVELAYQMNQEVPPVIVGDVTRLRQVLINLLNNGLKFTEEGEVVLSVTTEAVPIQPDGPYTLHFSVCDTGIGIPKDRLDRLFQAFSQVDASTSRKYGGTGLGLAISKRLSELMGGEMWVESVEGEGTIFHFTIAAPSGPDIKGREDLLVEQAQLRGKRVLIVDDNLTNRRILTLQTRAWGMLPRDTSEPAEALEWIKQGDPFDLAILDFHMPGMDGIQLSRAIRETRQPDELPLVLFSSINARELAMEAGLFAAFLMKPLKPSAMLDTLMNLFAGEATRIEAVDGTEKDKIDGQMAERMPLRILLVEDNAVNQKLALRLLAQMGYKADLAGNGLEAIQAVERQKYDVVLMDVQMPEMDGLEASRRICARWPRGERPYIVAMTANAMQGDRERCLEAGMDDYVSKPVRVNELVAAMGKAKPMTVPGDGQV